MVLAPAVFMVGAPGTAGVEEYLDIGKNGINIEAAAAAAVGAHGCPGRGDKKRRTAAAAGAGMGLLRSILQVKVGFEGLT